MLKYKEAILYIFFLLIGFIFAITKIQPEIVSIFLVEKNITDQSSKLLKAEQELETLKKARLEKLTLTGQTKNIYKPEIPGLDVEVASTVLFDDVIDMAKYNGIKIYSIEYVYNPPEDEFVKGAPDKYNVCQLNMSIIADYQDLESFLKELYKYPYFVNFDKIELTPYPKNKKILMSTLQIRLYSNK